MISQVDLKDGLIEEVNTTVVNFDDLSEIEMVSRNYLISNGFKVVAFKFEDNPLYWVDMRITCIDSLERGIRLVICIVKRLM